MKTVSFIKVAFVFAFLLPLFILSSCSKSDRILSIEENNLFSLDYGNFEEQINLFSLSSSGGYRTALAMRDGFFYIVNGEAHKILSLNSYGDMLVLYYKEDAYSSQKEGLPAKSSSGLWKPVAYPFDFDGKITVDSRKYMYTAAYVPKDRNEHDETEKLLYNQVVLRFSSDGSVIDYIGQQGPGGTPFPYIKEIHATENDELVVVCRSSGGLTAYWFAKNGFLKYKIPVLSSSIPVLSSENITHTDSYTTVDNIIPDCYMQRLYVKADYYVPHIDSESKVQSGVEYAASAVYPLEADTGIYGEAINVAPYEEYEVQDFSRITYKIPYEFLGVTKNGWLFFIVTTADGYSVEMIQPGSRYVIKRNFKVNHAETLYYSLNLSEDGIISALLAGKNNARVVWWHTDTLIASILKN